MTGLRPIDAVRAEVDQLAAALANAQAQLTWLLLATVLLSLLLMRLLWR